MGIFLQLDGLTDLVVETLKLTLETRDFALAGSLRLGEGGRDVLQVGAILGSWPAALRAWW